MTGARILSGASVFLVADVEKAAAHYRDALGFSFDRFWGDPPDFCMVWRGEFCVMLCRAPDRADIRPISTVVTSVWDAYFWVRGVDALHTEHYLSEQPAARPPAARPPRTSPHALETHG